MEGPGPGEERGREEADPTGNLNGLFLRGEVSGSDGFSEIIGVGGVTNVTGGLSEGADVVALSCVERSAVVLFRECSAGAELLMLGGVGEVVRLSRLGTDEVGKDDLVESGGPSTGCGAMRGEERVR